MAFPDDYRRWQAAGGNAAIVDAQVGLLRQFMVDTTNLNIRLMDTEINFRTVYAEAALAGQTVLEYGSDGKAAREVIDLTREVVDSLSAAVPA